jgi:hypothetical protein
MAEFCEHSNELLGFITTMANDDDTEVIIPDSVHTENHVLHLYIYFGT